MQITTVQYTGGPSGGKVKERLGDGLICGKAEDAGGLAPVKDDNAATGRSSPRTALIYRRMDH